MAHELTLRADGTAEMAFVGDTPWHRLGQSVLRGATIGEWQKAAGMDWTAEAGTPAVMGDQDFVDFPEYKGLYRSDTQAPLAIVGKDYQIVQPSAMLEFFRDLTESGGWHIHTAGTMRGGRRLWAMATCEDAKKYVKPAAGNKDKHGDAMCLNLLLATSMDGSMKTTAMLTTVRVVCANTLRMAMAGRDGHAQVQLTHRSTFDSSFIKEVLGVEAAQGHFDGFMEKARAMSETPIALDEARDVLARVFRSTAAAKPSFAWLTQNIAQLDAPAEGQDHRAVGRVLELFDGAGMGADLATARGTRWGLLNAVTQYVDHEQGRTPDTRLDAAWFGRGRDAKEEVLDILTEDLA